MAIVLDGTSGITSQSIITVIPMADSLQPITASVGSSALTVTLNPTILNFRNTPLTSGTINTRTVASAISVVVPSTATLGTVSAKQSRIVVIALDNAGTVELAVVNISGGTNLDETTLISTTAISAAATSASVVYSTAAVTASPFRVVGYIESTQATAGTWATAPSTIQGQGGQALAAMSSLGYGQTWQNMTGLGGRASGVTIYNTSGKPIVVCVLSSASQQNIVGSVVINGITVKTFQYAFTTAANQQAVDIIVPTNGSYIITLSSGGLSSWLELR
jgi:hypothetical protein